MEREKSPLDAIALAPKRFSHDVFLSLEKEKKKKNVIITKHERRPYTWFYQPGWTPIFSFATCTHSGKR